MLGSHDALLGTSLPHLRHIQLHLRSDFATMKRATLMLSIAKYTQVGGRGATRKRSCRKRIMVAGRMRKQHRGVRPRWRQTGIAPCMDDVAGS